MEFSGRGYNSVELHDDVRLKANDSRGESCHTRNVTQTTRDKHQLNRNRFCQSSRS